jgi:hypothetical protein
LSLQKKINFLAVAHHNTAHRREIAMCRKNSTSNGNDDGSTRGMAAGLLSSVRTFEFIACLCSLSPVLAALNTVSEYLQQKSIDLLQAHRLVRALKAEIHSMRTDDKWAATMKMAADLAKDLDITAELHQERRRKVPRRLDDGSSASAYFDATEQLKINLYFNTLDRIIAQLTERFPDELCDFAFLQSNNMQSLDGEARVRRIAERFHQFELDADRAVSQVVYGQTSVQ